MSYKVDESTLMAYLYDELSTEERSKVEAYLEKNEAARTELEELKETRFLLNKIRDRDVEIPRFKFDQSNVVVGASNHQSWWKYPMSIAASIAFLLIVGYLTSFQVSVDEGGLQVAFGVDNSVDSNKELYTKSQVESIVSDALKANTELVDQRMSAYKNSITSQVAQKLPAPDQELLNEYMTRLRDFNRETLRSMLENSEQSQKDYTDKSLQELAVFLDIQRRNDLEVIQTRFQNFEDDAEYNQLQTNQILTNLISSVEEQPSNQY